MNIVKATQFLLREAWWKIKPRPLYSFEPDKKPNKLVYILGMFGGFFYRNFQRRHEALRIAYRNQERRKTEYTIPLQILHHSKGMIIFLGFTFGLVLLGDWGIRGISHLISNIQLNWFQLIIESLNFFIIPDRDFLKLVLEVLIGAISAILGLLYALYGVGFQITTEKYSSKVIDYVNQETVGNFFFRLLVFTDVFAILVLLRVQLISLYPSLSFAAVIMMVIICLVGIIVFKSHYALSLKPKSLFERLQSDIKEDIRLASDRNRYSYKSWSIVQRSRMRTQDLFLLVGTLFEDLWHAENWNDVIFAPRVLSNLLTEYAKKKKYIDRERGWWFPQSQVEVKASNMSSLAIKLNFELQGKGPLMMGNPDYLWFEDSIFQILQNVESRIDVNRDKTHLLTYVINFYQTTLAGDYSQDRYGRYEKTVAGLYENQEIDAFDKYLDAFFGLYEKIKTDDELDVYLNAYFAVGLTLVEGFGYSKYQEIIKSMVNLRGRMNYTREHVSSLDLPSLFYDQILDYWDRLNLEVQCEGRVITPQTRLEKETLDDVRVKEKQYFDKFFDKLSKHQNTILADLYKKGNYKRVAQFIKVRFEWFSRMIYIGKTSLAEQYSSVVAGGGVYLPFLSKQILLEFEFWEVLEKLIFPSVIENCPTLFKSLTSSLVLMLPVINTDEKDIDSIVYRNRLPVVIGGFAYLFSELRQNNSFLAEYVRIIELGYKPGAFVRAIEMLANPKEVGGRNLAIKLINWETTRYHHWFVELLRQIDQLPKTYDNVRFYGGLQEVADHPSKFIRELSYRAFNPEEECMDEFVDWIKKREIIKELILILKKKT